MAFISAQGYTFEIDGYDAGTNAATASVELEDIVEFNGINPMEMTTPGTSFGDGLTSVGSRLPARRFRTSCCGAFWTRRLDSAFGRIGRSAGRVDYPSRTLTVTHATGLSQAIEVVPIKNNLGPELDGVTMFEAEFMVSEGAATAYVETGY